jgi:hypothetical protein
MTNRPDLRQLFKLNDIETAELPQRIKLARYIETVLKSNPPVIIIQMPPEAAAILARDIDFAAQTYPFGVPEDVVMPSCGYDSQFDSSRDPDPEASG